LFETLDKLAVRKPAQFCRRANARDPEAAKGSLFDPPIPVSESQGSLHGFTRGTIQPSSASNITLGQLHYFFSSLAGFAPAFSSWHLRGSFLFG
jgi:hypothetical protein